MPIGCVASGTRGTQTHPTRDTGEWFLAEIFAG